MRLSTELTLKSVGFAICAQIGFTLGVTLVWWAASYNNHIVVDEIVDGELSHCFITEKDFYAGYNRFRIVLDGDNVFDFIISTNESEALSGRIDPNSPYIQPEVSQFNRTSITIRDGILYWVDRKFRVVICTSLPIPVHISGYMDIKSNMLVTNYSDPITLLLWSPTYIAVFAIIIYGVYRIKTRRPPSRPTAIV